MGTQPSIGDQIPGKSTVRATHIVTEGTYLSTLDLGEFLPDFWRYIGLRLTMVEALWIHRSGPNCHGCYRYS